MSEPAFNRTPAAVPLDRGTLLARFDGIRQFAPGAAGPHKPLLLLYALARLKYDPHTEITFNARPFPDWLSTDRRIRVDTAIAASARLDHAFLGQRRRF